MPVLFVGSKNLSFFPTVRFLRDRGIDAHLLVLRDDPPRDHPSHDSFGLDYQQFTHTAPWGNPSFVVETERDLIRQATAPYRSFVATGASLAYLEHAGVKANIFVPHALDAVALTKFDLTRLRRRGILSLVGFPYLQRKAIKNAGAIAGPHAASCWPWLNGLGFTGNILKHYIPGIYCDDFFNDCILEYRRKSNWFQDISALRAKSDVLLVIRTSSLVNRSDGVSAVRAFAAAVREHPKTRLNLVVVEQGGHSMLLKQTVDSLELSASVHFFPPMPRREWLLALSLVDGAIRPDGAAAGEQISEEMLAMGVPFLTVNDRVHGQAIAARGPAVPSDDRLSLSDGIRQLLFSPDQIRSSASAARMAHRTNVIEPAMVALADLLGELR
jgi:hypothetical protein